MTLKSEPWTPRERAVLARLTTPGKIQAFLNSIPYSADPVYRCPRSVMRDRKAHCFDGAVFAAAALRRIGFHPVLVDMRAVRDDDHILTVFSRYGSLGAIAKSNFVGLRFREPIFRGYRELVLSYFEVFYNIDGEKTLRAYSVPLDLRAFEKLAWRIEDSAMAKIASRLDSLKHFRLLTPRMEAGLEPMDDRSLRAGLLGVNEAGLYRPRS